MQDDSNVDTLMVTTAIPLSFPAILRNPGLQDRFGHLKATRSAPPSAPSRKARRRDENDGKRWMRRKDNERFVGNPHIVFASKRDYNIDFHSVKSTFPEPLPIYLPRSAKLPTPEPPAFDPSSANAGRFSLSLKGMRRELRRSGRRAQFLVRDVELAITDWLTKAGSVLSPDFQQRADDDADCMVGETETIFEVSRTPFQLVWRITDDAFARYVVHCCARYHEVVSYSKEVSGARLTYLLRPNVARPDFFAPSAIATPPVTDVDSSSQFDPESDFTDIDSLSGMSDIEEIVSIPASSQESLPESLEAWSISGDTDLEADNEQLSPAIQGLSIADSHRTPRQLRARVVSQVRSVSSPSRSPARIPFQPVFGLAKPKPKSFFEYLFS